MKSIIPLLILISFNLSLTALIKRPHQIKFTKRSIITNLQDKFLLSKYAKRHQTEFEILIKSAEKHNWNFRYKRESRLLTATLQNDKNTKYKYEEFSPNCIGAKFVDPLDIKKCVNSVEYIEKRSVCPENYILVGHGNCIKRNDCPSGMIPSPVIFPVPCIPILRPNEDYTCAPGEIQIGGKACINPKNCEKGQMPAPFRWKSKCIEMPNTIKAWNKREIQKLTKIKMRIN